MSGKSVPNSPSALIFVSSDVNGSCPKQETLDREELSSRSYNEAASDGGGKRSSAILTLQPFRAR